MFAILLQAIAMASNPDSTEILTESHIRKRKRPPPIKTVESVPRKKARQWKGVYEHKDTPLHHH